MVRGRESLPPQPNRPRRRRSISSEAEQDVSVAIPPSLSDCAGDRPPDFSETDRRRSNGLVQPPHTPPPYHQRRSPSPVHDSRINSRHRGNGNDLTQVHQSYEHEQLERAINGSREEEQRTFSRQRHRDEEQEQLDRALAHSRYEEQRIREQRELNRHTREEDELTRVLEQTRITEVENASRRENEERKRMIQEEEEMARILRESAQAERERLDHERRLIEERERAFGTGQPANVGIEAHGRRYEDQRTPVREAGQTASSGSPEAAQIMQSPAPGSAFLRGIGSRAERNPSRPNPSVPSNTRNLGRRSGQAIASRNNSSNPIGEIRREPPPPTKVPPPHQSPAQASPSYPLRGTPSRRGRDRQPPADADSLGSVAMVPPRPREQARRPAVQRGTNDRANTRGSPNPEFPTPFRVPTGDLERATQDSLQQRALQILATAEEGSPAYIRAMAAFETPAAALDAEYGLPEHLAPPAYEDVACDKVVDHLVWTTDGKGDEPGRKRRLTERDWKKMDTWKAMLAKESAGEDSTKGNPDPTKLATTGVVQHFSGSGGNVVSNAENSPGTIAELLDRPSTAIAAARTSQPSLAPRHEQRASERRQRVEGAQRRDNQRFSSTFSRIPGRAAPART